MVFMMVLIYLINILLLEINNLCRLCGSPSRTKNRLLLVCNSINQPVLHLFVVVHLWHLTMRLTFGSIFELIIRYAYQRDNTYYYQRQIPLDLLERYEGIKLIKVNLKTTNLKKIAKQISALNKQHGSIWSLLRLDPTLKPFPVHKEAIKLLANHRLKPKPATNEEPNIDQFIDLLQVKQEAYAQGDEEIYLNAESEGYLDPVEIEAVRLINEAPKFRLSDALDIYLNGHLKKNDEKFCTYTRRVWNKLLEIVGDKEFEQVTRADASSFISKRLSEGSKTATVDRQISTIMQCSMLLLLRMN